MKNLRTSILIQYCDKCAKKFKYPIEKEKTKDSCGFCNFPGYVNQTFRTSIVPMENFNPDIWHGMDFEVYQLVSFPPDYRHDKMYTKLSYKRLTDKCLLFYDKDFLIIVNTKTGQQIQINF